MSRYVRWVLIAGIVCLVGVLPIVHYRSVYAHSKRLRVVTPGRVYRSGQMTAEGFRDAVATYGIRAVINLQDDFLDPDISKSYLNRDTVKESELCRELGVRFVTIAPDLVGRKRLKDERPEAIDQFLALMDDPDTFPVLLHCKAGLHRTGCFVAIYRMEYEGWTTRQAFREMKDNGFGEWACTADNDYVMQYVLAYKPGVRAPVGGRQ
jgi:protein tyrosine/serine phosphatase